MRQKLCRPPAGVERADGVQSAAREPMALLANALVAGTKATMAQHARGSIFHRASRRNDKKLAVLRLVKKTGAAFAAP